MEKEKKVLTEEEKDQEKLLPEEILEEIKDEIIEEIKEEIIEEVEDIVEDIVEEVIEEKEDEEIVEEEVLEEEQVEEVLEEEPVEEVLEEEVDPNKELNEKVKALSSEFKMNLFSKEGVIELADLFRLEKESASALLTEVETLTNRVEEYVNKEIEYENRLAALELGFSPEVLPEVLALASVYMKEGQSVREGLAVVKEKYGTMFAVASGAGILHNDTQARNKENISSDFERYAADNPKYRNYYKNK